MSKKNKKKKCKFTSPSNGVQTPGGSSPPSQTLESLLKETEAAIAEGRGRKAMVPAKLAMRIPGYTDAAHPQVRLAHELRVSEMLAVGQTREAEAMLADLIRNHPAWKNNISTSLRIQLDFMAGTDHLIGRFGTGDAALDAEVTAWVRRKLANPKHAAKHPKLAETHPLRRDAQLVVMALEEVESESGPALAYERMLSMVGRRSPFADWRLFVQGLAAFYKTADADALACLDRIPPDAILRKTADALTAAARNEKSPVADLMAAQTPAGAFKRKLQLVQSLAGQRLHNDVLSRLKELRADPFLSDKPGLLIEICARAFTFNSDFDGAERFITRLGLDPRMVARIVLMHFAQKEEDILDDWTGLLEIEPRLTKAERALVLARMGELSMNKAIDGDEEEDEDFYDADFEDEADFEEAGDDEVDERRLKDARDNFMESARLLPSAVLFQKWLDAESVLPPERRDTVDVLRRWSEALPEDITPLLRMVKELRQQGECAKAVELFDRLDKLAAGNPEVEAVRGYVHVDHAIALFREGAIIQSIDTLKVGDDCKDEFLKGVAAAVRWILFQCLRQVDALVQRPSPPPGTSFKSLLKAAFSPLRWMTAAKDKLTTAAAKAILGQGMENYLEELRQPLTALHVLDRIQFEGFNIILPKSVMAQFEDPDIVAVNFHLLAKAKDPEWGISALSDQLIKRIATCFATTTLDSNRLVECGLFLLEFHDEEKDGDNEIGSLLFSLTDNGLRRGDARLPSFLALRAKIFRHHARSSRGIFGYARTPGRHAVRCHKCLDAARHFAERRRDENELRFVRSAMQSIDAAQRTARQLTDAEADTALADELANPRMGHGKKGGTSGKPAKRLGRPPGSKNKRRKALPAEPTEEPTDSPAQPATSPDASHPAIPAVAPDDKPRVEYIQPNLL